MNFIEWFANKIGYESLELAYTQGLLLSGIYYIGILFIILSIYKFTTYSPQTKNINWILKTTNNSKLKHSYKFNYNKVKYLIEEHIDGKLKAYKRCTFYPIYRRIVNPIEKNKILNYAKNSIEA